MYLDGRAALSSFLDLLLATPISYVLPWLQAQAFIDAVARARTVFPLLPKHLGGDLDLISLCRQERDVLAVGIAPAEAGAAVEGQALR